MTFGEALEEAKKGKKVSREGWNGKGMWVTMSPGATRVPTDRLWAKANREFAAACGGHVDVLPFMSMKTADGKILLGWLASQTDMLANDWSVIE